MTNTAIKSLKGFKRESVKHRNAIMIASFIVLGFFIVSFLISGHFFNTDVVSYHNHMATSYNRRLTHVIRSDRLKLFYYQKRPVYRYYSDYQEYVAYQHLANHETNILNNSSSYYSKFKYSYLRHQNAKKASHYKDLIKAPLKSVRTNADIVNHYQNQINQLLSDKRLPWHTYNHHYLVPRYIKSHSPYQYGFILKISLFAVKLMPIVILVLFMWLYLPHN